MPMDLELWENAKCSQPKCTPEKSGKGNRGNNSTLIWKSHICPKRRTSSLDKNNKRRQDELNGNKRHLEPENP